MKPYASYKPSGVPWLGDVPSHWSKKRLRDCVEGCSNGVWGDDPDGEGDDIPVIRVADFDRPRRRVVEYETIRKVEPSQRRGRTLVPGDMLIEKSGGGDQQPVGMVVSYQGPEGAVCSNFVARMPARNGVVSRFMVYLHAHLYACRVTNISIKQTTGIQNLDTIAYLSEPCYLPPEAEQQSIADYLDIEVARIDELVREKDDLVRLLAEHRQGIACDAVMRGLKRDVILRSVGHGFGSIPAHWRMIPLKRFVKTSGGHTPSTDNPAYWTGVMPWVSPKDMKRAELSDSIDHISDAAVSECGLTVVTPGATLVVVRGMILAHSFPIARNLVPVTINQDMKAIQPVSDVLPEYLPWLLRGVTPIVLSLTEQSAHGTLALRTEKFFGEAFPIPPLDEQRDIIKYLESELQSIDELIAHTNDEIALLKELRAATIADAVLGRIDVRTQTINKSREIHGSYPLRRAV